ncbi:ATP-binding protein [Belliella marina]|uniref:histidine kinase n=1 Tax=Belliella marina TaxID=1644146 RepID=A0ABW4VV28_9BACT
MKSETSGKLKFENLRWRYLMALSAIALTIIISQTLLQHHISRQITDSAEINLSGRQRMLSQRISKAVLMLSISNDSLGSKQYANELNKSLQEWTNAHQALQYGNSSLGVKGVGDEVIKSMFAEIQPSFDLMVDRSQKILDVVSQRPAQAELDSVWVSDILEHESVFLAGMDEIVYTFDQLAYQKVVKLRKIEIILLVITLVLIFIEVRFIFWPSALLIRSNFAQLSESETNAKAMALELASLYDTLENSYLEIVDTDVAIEDLVLFGKCRSDGDFTMVSEQFSEIMQFINPPENFFVWLQDQGVEELYVSKIRELLLEGRSWDGELRLFNSEGDFVWLDMHLTPVLALDGSVSEILLVAADMTDVKEARVKSQEIHREKLEKKLKEQQYRSSLILEGQEEERRRISRDLHDGIGQYLTALKYSLDGINDVKSKQELIRLDVSKDLIGKVIKEVRRVSFHLTPVALSDYGIASVLHKFSQEMSKISRIPVTFENQTGFISRLESKVENNIYRVVQEAVNNSIKYSEASEIKIQLSHNSRYLHLEISDDGVGFDYTKLKDEGHFKSSGHGIFNIKERVNLINGNFELQTSKGNGTVIRIEIELENKLVAQI